MDVADGLEDKEVMEAVTGLLRRVTGDLALPSPDRLIRSVSVSIYAIKKLNLKESLFMYLYHTVVSELYSLFHDYAIVGNCLDLTFLICKHFCKIQSDCFKDESFFS